MRRFAYRFAALGVTISVSAHAQDFRRPPLVHTSTASVENEVVRIARKYAGMQYRFGGRNTVRRPHLDCVGLLLAVLRELVDIPWNKWSHQPSKFLNELTTYPAVRKTIRGGQNATHELTPGDFLFFFSRRKVPDDPVLIEGRKHYWVSHTGIYLGNGRFIHASSRKKYRQVVEESLDEYLKKGRMHGLIAVTVVPRRLDSM